MDSPKHQEGRVEELARRLSKHPQLSEPIEAMLKILEDETGSGCSADVVEEKVVTQVRAMGRAALQSWAGQAAAQARPVEGARQGRRHSKKNSGG